MLAVLRASWLLLGLPWYAWTRGWRGIVPDCNGSPTLAEFSADAFGSAKSPNPNTLVASSHRAFAIRVRFRHPYRYSQDLQTESFDLRIDLLRENRVAVVNEKPVSVLARNRLAKLLQRPFCRRMSRNVAVQYHTAPQFQDYADLDIRKLAVIDTRKSQATVYCAWFRRRLPDAAKLVVGRLAKETGWKKPLTPTHALTNH